MSSIKIPSIRIYDKENDKYIDNVVGSIDYSAPQIRVKYINNEDGGMVVEQNVHKNAVDESFPLNTVNNNAVIGFGTSSLSSLSTFYMRYRVYTILTDVTFPRSQDNNKKYIYSIDMGYDNDEDGNTKAYASFSNSGTLSVGDCEVTIGFVVTPNIQGLLSQIDNDRTIMPKEFSGEPDVSDYNSNIKEKFSKLYNNIDVYGDSNEISVSVQTNFSDGISDKTGYVTWEIDANDNIVIHNLEIPVMYYAWYPRDVEGANVDENFTTIGNAGNQVLVGNYVYTLEKMEPTSFTLNIRATYRDISEEEMNKTYPSIGTSTSDVTVEGNSLSSVSTIILKPGLEYADTTQDCSSLLNDNGWFDTMGNSGSNIVVKTDQKKNYESPLSVFRTDTTEPEFIGFIKSANDMIPLDYHIQSFSAYKCVSLADYAPRRIYSIWKNGKETATIRVSVNDYYDTDGNLALSIIDKNLPMLFKKGDIVIPYVATPNGDRPMSSNPDGTPKEFLVTGVTLISDGAVWQELQLQEVSG